MEGSGIYQVEHYDQRGERTFDQVYLVEWSKHFDGDDFEWVSKWVVLARYALSI